MVHGDLETSQNNCTNPRSHGSALLYALSPPLAVTNVHLEVLGSSHTRAAPMFRGTYTKTMGNFCGSMCGTTYKG
jgi:hypothetical protein